MSFYEGKFIPRNSLFKLFMTDNDCIVLFEKAWLKKILLYNDTFKIKANHRKPIIDDTFSLVFKEICLLQIT